MGHLSHAQTHLPQCLNLIHPPNPVKHPTSSPPATKTRHKPTTRSNKQRIEDSFARHGKIARLPRKIRNEFNQRLDEGWAGPPLVKWLKGRPETRRALKEHFNGQPISQQNLSQWRLGGYRDWLLNQEAREAMEDFAADSRGLEGKMGFEFADKLALWLCMRYAVMTRHLERMDPLESWKPIRQMCRDVVALRRGDFKLRKQRLKEEMQKELTEEDHMEWVSVPGRLEQLYYERTNDEKVRRKIEKKKQDRIGQILGMTPEPDPDEEDEAQSAQPKAAQAGGGKFPGKSSKTKARSARRKTKSHKVEQSKTKRKAPAPPPAVQKPKTKNPPSPKTFHLRSEASAGQAGAASQTPTGICANPPDEPVKPDGQVGLVGQNATAPVAPVLTQATITTPDPPAPKPLTGPGITFPKRPASAIAECYCGARNQISLADCEPCYTKWAQGNRYCPCH